MPKGVHLKKTAARPKRLPERKQIDIYKTVIRGLVAEANGVPVNLDDLPVAAAMHRRARQLKATEHYSMIATEELIDEREIRKVGPLVGPLGPWRTPGIAQPLPPHEELPPPASPPPNPIVG